MLVTFLFFLEQPHALYWGVDLHSSCVPYAAVLVNQLSPIYSDPYNPWIVVLDSHAFGWTCITDAIHESLISCCGSGIWWESAHELTSVNILHRPCSYVFPNCDAFRTVLPGSQNLVFLATCVGDFLRFFSMRVESGTFSTSSVGISNFVVPLWSTCIVNLLELKVMWPSCGHLPTPKTIWVVGLDWKLPTRNLALRITLSSCQFKFHYENWDAKVASRCQIEDSHLFYKLHSWA